MVFSLSGLLQKITSAVGGAPEGSVVGIDIGSSSVKIVQMRASRGVAILETYGEIALGPYAKQSIGKAVKLPPEKVAEAILDLMKEANVTARSGGISVPFSSSLVSVVEFPKVDKATLAHMVPIEARKYIPLPVSEVTLDWLLIPADKEGEGAKKVPGKVPSQEVLIVAIHNDAIQTYKSIAAATGLDIGFYEIEIFSAARAALEHGLAPVLVVDIGAAATKMYVVEHGVVRLTHLATVGGQRITETLTHSLGWDFEKAERVKRERGLIDTSAYSVDENERIKTAMLSTLTRLFSEANRVVLSYGQRYNKNIAHIVMTGGGASLPGLAEEARKTLGGSVSIADPFSRTETPAFLSNVLREIGPGFSVSVGLALRKLKAS